jgi:hypothetical protein
MSKMGYWENRLKLWLDNEILISNPYDKIYVKKAIYKYMPLLCPDKNIFPNRMSA